jgi:hypothetical protein
MTTRQSDVRTQLHDTTQSLKRRGLLAAAVSLVAAAVAKISERPVFAGVDGDVVLVTTNTTAGVTAIDCSSS